MAPPERTFFNVSSHRNLSSAIAFDAVFRLTDAVDHSKEQGQEIRGFLSRRAPSPNIPSHEQLMAIKRKKKVSATYSTIPSLVEFPNLS